MSIGELAGWLGAALTVTAFSMRSMLALRLVAVGANLSFIAYGAVTGLEPVIVLHACLLPCNLFRLWQLRPLAPDWATMHSSLAQCRSRVCTRRAPAVSSAAGRTSDGPVRDWLILTRPPAHRH